MYSADEPRSLSGAYTADALGISDAAYGLVRDLIEERVGVRFDDAKRGLLTDKLTDLVVSHGFTSLLDYYYLLRYDPDADRHWRRLLDRLAVPETYFWRQSDQIEALANVVVPELIARRPRRAIRIWSAGCCSGEEPLSIAIALAERGLFDRADIRIEGSDASEAMLARARGGVYGERAFRAIPLTLRERWFQRQGDEWRIDPAVHARVEWSQVNLANPAEVRPHAAVDVIFCRNVFIYFSDAAMQRTLRAFAECMADDGSLFLGASESLTRFSSELQLQEVGGAFVYRRAIACNPPSGDAGVAGTPALSILVPPAA